MRARPALLTLLLACGCAASEATAPAPAPAPAPAAALVLSGLPVVTLEGERTSLGHVMAGRVALVNLWATWCEACVKELGAMNRLADRTSGRSDAVVLGVAVGESGPLVEAFRRAHGMTYLQVVDPDFALADALGQRRVPATLVVDREGRVIYRGDALDGASLAAFRGALGEGGR